MSTFSAASTSASSASASATSSLPASTSSTSASSSSSTSSSSSPAYSPWSRTVIGSLTTTFTPPASCSINIAEGYDDPLANYGQYCSGTSYSGDTACWPPSSFGAPLPSSAGLEFHGWGFYSPGWICPAGYTTACSATGGGSTGVSWPGQFPLASGETAVGCCPTGFQCGLNSDNNPSSVQLCTKTAVSTDTFPIGFCPSGTLIGTSMFTMSDPETWSSSGSALFTSFGLAGPLIDIRWQSTDRPTSTSNPTKHPTPNPPSGLSTGAKIAIGVVVPVVVLAVLAGIMAFFYRRRKKRRTAWQQQQNPPQPTWYQPDKSEGHMVARYAGNDYQEPSELVGSSSAGKHRTGEPGDVIEATPLHEVEDTSPRIGGDKRN